MKIVRTNHRRGLWRAWRVALQLGEEEVSRVSVVVKPMRIGSATVRIGGIAGMGTKDEYRMKGYASRVMEDATELMYEQGYEMGWLYGIPDFYHRFGYAVGFPECRLQVQVEDLLQARSALSARAMKKADAPAVRRLYNRLNALRTGTVVRPAAWEGFELWPVWSRRSGRSVLATTRGQVRGYAAYRPEGDWLYVGEVAGLDGAAFETLAAALAQRARRARSKGLIFHLPPDDALVAFCTRYGCQKTVAYHGNRGAMGRIIHLRPLMEKLAPELSRRLVEAGFSWRGTLAIETDIGSVELRINGTRVAVSQTPGRDAARVKLPQMRLTQLVMGYRSVADVAYEADVQIPARAMGVMGALFPTGEAYMWWSDRF